MAEGWHLIALGLCILLASLVFAVLLYSTMHALPRHVSKAREFAWGLVPILIITAAATPALRSVTQGTDVHFAGTTTDPCMTAAHTTSVVFPRGMR